MVRVAHLSDTHLGYRQYNLDEREDDIYEVFNEIADKILEERVDVVIHCGDLFDSWRPTTQANYAFKKFLDKLEGKTKLFSILGDHDTPKRREMPPQMLFDDRICLLGLNGGEYQTVNVSGTEVLIAGISNLKRRYREILISELKKLDAVATKYEYSILALHQAIEKFLPFKDVWELRLEDLPKNFVYYAMGHLHSRIRASHGRGELAYSGSTEIGGKDEISSWQKYGKGFYIVDLENDKVEITNVDLESIRPQLYERISYLDFDAQLKRLVDSLENYSKKPIVHLRIEGKQIDRQMVYEALDKLLTNRTLRFRPEIIEATEQKNVELKPGSFKIGAVLKEYLGDEEIASFANELFNLLKYGDIHEAKIVADRFYRGVKK